MSASAQNGSRDAAAGQRVAIVGGGAAGAVAAVHLLRESRERGGLEIELIDRSGSFGPGVAYGTADPLHLLNVPAVRMGAVSGHPKHFHEWLLAHGHEVGEEAFMPRGVYGEYLRDLLAEAERSNEGVGLRRREGEVIAITEPDGLAGGPLELSLRDGRRLEADRVVLALGPLGSGDPIPIPSELKQSQTYVSDPWVEGALDAARSDRVALIIGTGLTMVDVALSLCSAEGGPRVRAVSRHGLVPKPHRRDLTRVRRFPLPLGSGSLEPVVAAVLAQIGRVAQQGDDWRDVIDSMRPETPAVWRSLRIEEKRRFLAEMQRLWDVHRFRMAPDVADRFEQLCAAGRVRFDADSIVALEPHGGGVRVSLRTLGQHDLETIDVDRIINCTGAGCDLRRQAPPLLEGLLASGRARPDELGLGLDVDERGALLEADGRPSERIFAVGSLRKGVEWEAIGITEIRDHAAAAAQRIVAAGAREPAPVAATSGSNGSDRTGGLSLVRLDPIETGGAVARAIAELRAGRMVLLCDDREHGGEGDLLQAAEFVGAETVNFMAKEARGVICLALAGERCDELGLQPISPHGRSRLGVASMVSIEARTGVSTGISAADRARTIEVAVDPACGSDDLVQPGHVFPLRARDGGVLDRPGRIEAAVDLADLAGLRAAGVLCQVMRDDGHMARDEDLRSFAAKHGLRVVTVSEVVQHRLVLDPGKAAGNAGPGHEMREVMGHFATGVSVITARRADGAPLGTTANAISSVSLEPPLLLACLAKSSETLAAIRDSGRFAVNVLASHQREHSDRFAAQGDAARSHEVRFDDHPLGVPVLPGALATIACAVEASHPAGDHEIVVGKALSLARTEEATKPLLFYRGAYSQLRLEEDELVA